MSFFFVAIFLSAALAPQPGTPSAPEIAAALQKRYDTVHDFSADFTHQHQGGLLRRKTVEQGSLLVKKPGKMRWEYKTPEKKLFVSDGAKIYFYEPAANQVTVSDFPRGDQAASAALFLTGQGNLSRDFTATFTETAPADTYGLHLTPKTPQAEYDWLELVVDRQTLQIRSLTAADKEGGRSTFEFANVKENVGIADKTFVFQIPRGAEVIHAGRAKD
jgi:outer membrane lipoprotein carrier protein